MAEKKNSSQAEKKVSNTKKKVTEQASTKAQKSSAKKPAASGKKAPQVKTEYENPIPTSAIVAVFSLLLFILFVVISVNPDGALLKVIQSVVLGLIGPAGFYFSIPALLYLFVINTFSRKNAAKMRSFCLLAFVLLCGAI